MDSPSENTPGKFGLVASSSSGTWDVTIDESLDCDNEWLAEIEGPNLYVVFHLSELAVISDAVAFLDAGLHNDPPSRRLSPSTPVESLLLGKFGSLPLELVWDNEDVLRCFIVAGSESQSALRLTLDENDVRMLLQSLRQVAEDLCISKQVE